MRKSGERTRKCDSGGFVQRTVLRAGVLVRVFLPQPVFPSGILPPAGPRKLAKCDSKCVYSGFLRKVSESEKVVILGLLRARVTNSHGIRLSPQHSVSSVIIGGVARALSDRTRLPLFLHPGFPLRIS